MFSELALTSVIIKIYVHYFLCDRYVPCVVYQSRLCIRKLHLAYFVTVRKLFVKSLSMQLNYVSLMSACKKAEITEVSQ